MLISKTYIEHIEDEEFLFGLRDPNTVIIEEVEEDFEEVVNFLIVGNFRFITYTTYDNKEDR
jgi:hypothetical protein